MTRAYILVTDGFWRKSLSATRSLGKSGYKIHVIGDSIFTTAFWSLYTSNRTICPNVNENPSLFSKTVFDLLNKYNKNIKPIFLPMEDPSLEWASKNRFKLSKISNFLIPPDNALKIAQSKDLTMKVAKKIGISTPTTISSSSFEEFYKKILSLKSQFSSNNFLVKPSSGSGSSGIVYLNLKTKVNWKEHWDKYGSLLIQERISEKGQGIGISLIFDKNSKCIAHFAHARIHQYPNSGGPSTSRISIFEPKLLKQSIKLLELLKWQGVAMVEWKKDPKDDIAKLLEINPRFWGSLELSVRSGVDFPYLYAKLSAQEICEPIKKYKLGVICRWMFPGEFLRYVTMPRKYRENFIDFFKGLPQSAEEWDSSDLLGTLASFICPAISVLRPKYWKYLIR